tara:strand:+ start:16171 stop:17058 length:888 start_codon:yes stop_codon:yes gene_type:complete
MKFTTNYLDVWDTDFFERNFNEKIRDLLRSKTLDLLSLKNKLCRDKEYLKNPRVQFLYIHHVFEDELYNFDRLLKSLAIDHEFISYSEGVEKILKGEIDRPYIIISSDDGFKNNLDAAKILDRYGIKGCFFINPASIGLSEFKQIKKFCNSNLNFPTTEFMTWDDVESLLNSGHEIGSHTMNHIDISKHSLDEVESELSDSMKLINSKCGSVKHFAYPFGSYSFFNKEAMELVFSLGYESCASAERGCYFEQKKKINKNDLLIRRDHVVCAWDLDHIFYFLIANSKSKKNLENPF